MKEQLNRLALSGEKKEAKHALAGFLFRNMANGLTLIRLIGTLFIILIVMRLEESNVNHIYYSIFFLLSLIIWLSDYLDGKVARKFQIASNFGAAFDVIVDCIYVFSIHILLAKYGRIPVWFLFIMSEKIGNYIITSKIMSTYCQESFTFIRDYWGRLVSASFFVIPFISCSLQQITGYSTRIMNILLLVISCFSVYSSFLRMKGTIECMTMKSERVREK